ncbi:MAG: hypothetical protein K2H34_08440 [Lachnospiraceae bacterium]|nr:hypothetical protein [Lachnospiraceae bacterium]
MEQHYKSFMDGQHPSKELIADTVTQMKRISEEGEIDKSGEQDKKEAGTFFWYIGRKWRYYAAVFTIALLAVGGVWYQNTQVIYSDLGRETLSGAGRDTKDSQEETFGEERNSYLGLADSDYYIFDGDAELSELVTGQGKVTIRAGAVKNSGYQPLYQTKPQRIRGQEIYLGKEELNGEVILFAAFTLQNRYYYLEGEHVTEKEMTACIKELLKEIGKAEK